MVENSTLLITGANRGLGLEFVKQYAADGWQVLATCRDPDRAETLQRLASQHPGVEIHTLEVTDPNGLARMKQSVGDRPVDVLISNAGVFGPTSWKGNGEKQQLGSLDYDAWRNILEVNLLGAVRVAETFLPNVEAARGKIVMMDSAIGSISETEGGYYLYRTSKAALNMAMASMARDLKERNVIAVSFCPGWAKTELGGPGAEVEVSDSISGMRKLIAGLSMAQAGTFTRYNGDALDW